MFTFKTLNFWFVYIIGYSKKKPPSAAKEYFPEI